ncbi:MAG: xanthine dehydrogenase family protein molybdopterin-binding subunit [Betaproteobacteria bacterium]|nr:xanthine dehydrogenase family protein molybdopterin-binding subunit [Betaproteobacteria bacterium]
MGFVGTSVLRREDQRLLLGQGQYVADIELPGMLHVAFVRSDHAHAKIRAIDTSAAAAAPGVVLVLTGADLVRELPTLRDNQAALPKKWTSQVQHKILNPRQPLLATDCVRHVGEGVAVVVAESRMAALDAAELVVVDLEPLPVVIDPDTALQEGAPVLHAHLGTNLIGGFSIDKGNAAQALRAAPHTLRKIFRHHRYAAMPIECRGAVSSYDLRTDSITIWSATQVVHWVRREVAATLGLPEFRVRCIAPDVGGGFGVKGHVYPDELIVAFLSRKLRRPVRWIEDRSEHFLSSCHSRDQVHDVEIGFDGEGRILAFHDRYVMDCGAYNPLGVSPVVNTAAHLQGPYRIPNFSVTARIAATNKVPNAPYRGAGRPEAVQVTERLMDLVARTLGLEPAEVRRRNMIRADEMPYSLGMVYRDGVPIVYDSGDYPGALAKALEAVGGVEAFRARQAALRKEGRYLGLGIGCYTEGTGAGPFEGATIRIDPSGKIHVCSGVASQGQGMETIFAQVAADWWQVAPENVVVTLGDTAAIPMGFGTVASRSTVNLSSAIHFASERLRKKCFDIASVLLECATVDLELRDGGVGVVGAPGASISFADLSRNSRGWDRVRQGGLEPGLEETFYYEPPTVTWAYAAHAAIVEVDAETGRVAIEQYAVAHDCGTVVNPMLADGQIIGGVAQGIGGGLLEEIGYDSEGQLQNGSFLDYTMPRASDMPDVKLVHQQIPTPLNPLGVKGLGEGGAIAPPVTLANAVCDALAMFGIEINETPIRPEQIVRHLKSRK